MAHSALYIRLMNSKQWRTLRNQWLTDHPTCSRCWQEHQHIVPAQCVHHMTPVESGRTDAECMVLAYSPNNLMSLCYRCHAEIHKAERSHSKAAHKERSEQRLEQWKARHGR